MLAKLRSNIALVILIFLSMALLVACGGGSGGGGVSSSSSATAPAATSPVLSYTGVRIFRFSWTDVSGATHYKLFENPDGASGFTQVGADISQGSQAIEHEVTLYQRLNAQYMLQSCNSVGCTDSSTISVSGNLAGAIGYFKASNAAAADNFGISISISDDGNTLAVGAYLEDSDAVGINGDQDNDLAGSSGAVYVFVKTGSTWSQQAYIKASNAEPGDRFGISVSLSADGNTLAVGASGEAGGIAGIGGNQADNSASFSGAVYVFNRSGSSWSQQTYIKASNPGASDSFGSVVSLSDNGDVLAVGAYNEGSNATDIDGDQTNDLASSAGAVYVFNYDGTNWAQQAYIKASNTDANDWFGRAISLSGDGTALAVGAPFEDSNGNPASNSRPDSGAVYMFKYNGTVWLQEELLKTVSLDNDDQFGSSVSLDANGSVVAIGAPRESSNATGIDGAGAAADNSAAWAGAVYIARRSFIISAWRWTLGNYIKASNTDAGDQFGKSISLSSDGSLLAVGAKFEDSTAAGFNGDQGDNTGTNPGAVYLFSYDGSIWAQDNYLKASNPATVHVFGDQVNLSGDGNTLAVATSSEDSSATGIGGDSTDDSASNAGAVYLY